MDSNKQVKNNEKKHMREDSYSSIKLRNSKFVPNKDDSKFIHREKFYGSTGQDNTNIYIEDRENKLRTFSKEKPIRTSLMDRASSKMALLNYQKNL